MMLRLLTFAFLLPFPSAWWAQEEDSVGQLFRKLDSDNISERDEAMATLRSMGNSIQGRLEQELRRTKSSEVRARLNLLIGSLKVPSDGGKLSNGLKIVLTANRDFLRMTDRLELKAAIWNATASPMNVFVGLSTDGVSLENGMAYRIRASPEKEDSEPRWRGKACGKDGWGPIYATILPFGSREFNSTAVPAIREGQVQYLLGEKGIVYIAAPEGDVHRFRAVVSTWDGHAPPGPVPVRRGPPRSAGSNPLDQSIPIWSGFAESNELVIKIEN